MGSTCLQIGLRVQGADHGIQFAHDHDPDIGLASFQVAFDTGDSQVVLVRDTQFVQCVLHQLGSLQFLETQLGIGKNLLADGDNSFFIGINVRNYLRFQLFFCHLIPTSFCDLMIPKKFLLRKRKCK